MEGRLLIGTHAMKETSLFLTGDDRAPGTCT